MKSLLKILLLLVASAAMASEIGNYPNASTLNGQERILADQGGPTGPSAGVKGVQEQQRQIDRQQWMIGILALWCFGLTAVVVRRGRNG